MMLKWPNLFCLNNRIRNTFCLLVVTWFWFHKRSDTRKDLRDPILDKEKEKVKDLRWKGGRKDPLPEEWGSIFGRYSPE